MLAGLIRSLNRFSPLRNPDRRSGLQRDAVLDRMMELKKISIGLRRNRRNRRASIPIRKRCP